LKELAIIYIQIILEIIKVDLGLIRFIFRRGIWWFNQCKWIWDKL